MTEAEAAFVEALAHHMSTRGMARMSARVMAWLLICDPPEQTAAQLADELQVSRAAISGAVRDLSVARIVRRGFRRGDRREYFSVPPGFDRTLLGGMSSILAQGREIADEGLALLADRRPEARARLQGFRDIYAHFEREWPKVVEVYLHRKSDRDERAERAATADDATPLTT